ncbi:hypothetical protein AVEN_33703-1, partial [Araneus ventricosus]
DFKHLYLILDQTASKMNTSPDALMPCCCEKTSKDWTPWWIYCTVKEDEDALDE